MMVPDILTDARAGKSQILLAAFQLTNIYPIQLSLARIPQISYHVGETGEP
jgi:hypothetical protein